MKKLNYLGFSFVIALSIFVSTLSIGSKPVSALQRDGTNPYTTGCANKKPIIYETTYIKHNKNIIGYVQLRGSAYCHTAWAFVKLYSPAPANNYVNAYVQRGNPRGWELSCNSSGGNKAVQYKQTSCYTPQIWDKDPNKARAKAYFPKAKFTASTNFH
ncbi:YjfA family protein [Shimazuella sp. AN120528]|uniref:DUF2690 domain-containing protein n=1 Tax=Shimazuella soli TaxID=1892854 RepID=UPI001F1101BD|nr:DUF2690 domain-containing protein [Shimazuella soli]MCH5584329.1 YjfA family protein [Shimazuella soli]